MHKSIVTFLYLCVQAFVATAQQNTKQPNVILIVADDLGWADLGCYGSTFYETPNLDKLAANGVRFSQGYATSPVCSPTRASIMTGKYPVKTGVTDWIKGRQEKGKPGAAIRVGSYKLVYFFEDKRIALYDLVNDVAEKNDLAVSHRKRAMRLSKKLFRWLENNAAKTPVINPGYSALTKTF